MSSITSDCLNSICKSSRKVCKVGYKKNVFHDLFERYFVFSFLLNFVSELCLNLLVETRRKAVQSKILKVISITSEEGMGEG